jgi:alpha-N-acetylglucosamine transferase
MSADVVVVGSTPGREGWLRECLASIEREVVVLRQAGTWELGKIQWLYENTKFDRFLFLHDSVIVKDQAFFDRMFEHPGSVSVTDSPGIFGMYMGIYTREHLSRVELYSPVTQRDSIRAEVEWTAGYARAAGDVPVVFPEFRDSNNVGFVEHHGRTNMILENDFLRKFKGTWG